jgi:hypothetical protein
VQCHKRELLQLYIIREFRSRDRRPKRIDHEISDEVDLLLRDSLAQQVAARSWFSRIQDLRNLIGQKTIYLLWHRRSKHEASLGMRTGVVRLAAAKPRKRRFRRPPRSRRWRQALKDRLERLRGFGGLKAWIPSDTQVDIGLPQTEIFEHLLLPAS